MAEYEKKINNENGVNDFSKQQNNVVLTSRKMEINECLGTQN
jgi:hypothetical protein